MAARAIAVGVVFLSSLVVAAVAPAQTAASGSIAGVVRDATGAVLPGVTVEAASPALIEKVRTAVTDDQGQYKILDLRPGVYSVTFALTGFSTVRREGIELTTGFTAPANAEMRVGAIEETVTVTGASPVVDVQNVRQRNVLSRDTLDTLPTGKTIQGYAALTVGVSVSGAGQDVGGNRNESAGALQIHGGRQGDQHLWIDGMRQNLGFSTAGGTIRLYMTSQANVQEITLETSGMGAESETGGIQINMVPKEGSNTVRSFATAAYTGENMQSENFTPALAARGLTTGASVRKIYDYSGGIGGPIRRDRLWFFASSRWWGADEYAPGNYFNKTPHTLFYTPDLSRPAYTNIYNRDHSLRLTWQAAASHKITFSTGHQKNCLCYFQVDQNIAPEAVVHQVYEPIHFEQGTWTYTATSRLLLQAGATWARNNRRGSRAAGTTKTDFAITELATGYRYGAAAGIAYNPEREAFGYLQRMDQTNGKFSVSYVPGSHAFKTGLFWFFGFANQANEAQDPPISYTFRNGVPTQVTYYAAPNFYRSRGLALGLFAQDQWTIDKLTLNLGVRFDSLNGWNPEVTRPAGLFVPEYHFPRMENLPNWKDVSPRIGAAFDLFGSGRTSIKASFGRYLTSEMTGIAITNHPANSIVTSATRTWADANSDYVPQESELGPLSNAAFGTVVINRRFADDVLLGSGARASNWQASASIQHELRPGVALNGGFFRTWYGNFTLTDNTRISNADFDPYCVAAPADQRLPGGGGYPICGLYDIKPTAFGAVENLVTQASNFGKRTEVSNFFDLTLNARFGAGGQVGGGLSTGRTVTDDCEVRIDSPDQRFCRQTNPWAGQTQVKLNGSYPLPYDVHVSGVVQNLPGIPVLANYTATNAQIAPSLGRPLGACRGIATCTGTASIGSLIEPFTMREDRLTQVDLRLTKIFRIGRARVQGMFDVYNLFNASTILVMNNTYGPTWLRPTSILAARLFKFGAQIDF